MENILDKNKWSEKDWDIFINNLEVLRNNCGLKKSEFSKRIGVQNIFRTDLKNRPSRGTIAIICQEFDVNQDWLGTRQTHAPPAQDQDLQPASPTRRELAVAMALHKTGEVLNSDTIYGQALETNINSYYAAVNLQKELRTYKKELQSLREEVERLKQQPSGEWRDGQKKNGSTD